MARTYELHAANAPFEAPAAPEISVVVTLYNEAESLDELYRRMVAAPIT